MENNLSGIEKLIEDEVQKRVAEIIGSKEETVEIETKEQKKDSEEIIEDFAELLTNLNEKEQYRILLSLIETDKMELHEFFAEMPTWMGGDYVKTKKQQIALQLLLESFIGK